ncbi:unnamed protein product, partial [Prorocentrum cordatum]
MACRTRAEFATWPGVTSRQSTAGSFGASTWSPGSATAATPARRRRCAPPSSGGRSAATGSSRRWEPCSRPCPPRHSGASPCARRRPCATV